MLEGGVAVAVVGRALVRILEDLVSLVDFLEARLGGFVGGIAIGMPLHGQLAKGRFQLPVTGSAVDFKNLVIAALCHPRVHSHRVRH